MYCGDCCWWLAAQGEVQHAIVMVVLVSAMMIVPGKDSLMNMVSHVIGQIRAVLLEWNALCAD